MPRQKALYDVYQDDEYLGRYTRAEISDRYGIHEDTVCALATTGRTSRDGYQIMHTVPKNFEDTWWNACENARKYLEKRRKKCAGSSLG